MSFEYILETYPQGFGSPWDMDILSKNKNLPLNFILNHPEGINGVPWNFKSLNQTLNNDNFNPENNTYVDSCTDNKLLPTNQDSKILTDDDARKYLKYCTSTHKNKTNTISDHYRIHKLLEVFGDTTKNEDNDTEILNFNNDNDYAWVKLGIMGKYASKSQIYSIGASYTYIIKHPQGYETENKIIPWDMKTLSSRSWDFEIKNVKNANF